MTIACCGPRTRRDMRLAAYDMDNVEPLDRVSGRLTFHADVRHEVRTRIANSTGCGKVCGKSATNWLKPMTITAAMYSFAATGRGRHAKAIGREGTIPPSTAVGF